MLMTEVHNWYNG